MREFQLIALTLPGTLDPAVAIAASHAGELGILDLESVETYENACQAVEKLARYAKNGYGLRLGSGQNDLLSDLFIHRPQGLRLILLAGPESRLLQQQVEAIRRQGLQVLLEATCLGHARLGQELGVDGIIAKGNEAGGLVGEKTTFVLVQEFLAQLSVPVYAQGGIGLHTAAACYAAGVRGVVLDAQLALTRESQLPAIVKQRIAAMDGSETICLGRETGEGFRIYHRPGQRLIQELNREEAQLFDTDHLSAVAARAAWWDVVRRYASRSDPDQRILPLGQDAAFAASLASRFFTVSGILAAVRQSVHDHCQVAARIRPFDQGTPLAQAHGTRYPIVQGPMTRVSDRAAFALEVAKAGGLPFLALGLLREPEAAALLRETRDQLAGKPWGAGILGFASATVREEQLQAILTVHPPFVLIAGGRPDQASRFEQEGITTYLHAPSPGLLEMFLAEGSRHIVLEGYECGGHVGPRSSFVLWESALEVLFKHLDEAKNEAHDLHILFAGGIHDATSSAMAAVLAAQLAERGVRVGVLMGTAYIFTEEAVSSQAIVPHFQQQVLHGDQTVVLETGPGHAIRCLPTPYTQAFAEFKRRLRQDGAGVEQVRGELEAMNIGRLRIASKGVTRHPAYGQDATAPKYLSLDSQEQLEQGLYMVGQAAGLRNSVCTISDLHRQVSVRGSARLQAWGEVERGRDDFTRASVEPLQIAIVGMACLLPRAPNLQAYWENILNGIDAIRQVPRERWDWERYFDADPKARDKIYSRWGGFLDDIPFDPLDYGMPPSSIPSVEPMQLLMLEVVRAALADAGYLDRPFPRERTSVIVGAGGGLGDLGYLYAFRSYLPHFLDADSADVIERLSDLLPRWTEDSFPGILLNVAAGRIANRFDLGGPNFVVDAACGSSLAALDVAIKDLETHRTDMAIVGAGDTVQSPFAFLAFSKTQALSPSGRARPFDADADGITISEGLAVVVLKRLEDAERDSDRIYAVIRGVGASSDGKDKGLTAPRPAGQLRALRRAYERAGFSPATVQLVEAHGTGTRVGDTVEIEALQDLFREFDASERTCAIGSAKSMIGHTKSTAGLAGLIKTVMALHHKVLPPTLLDRPNPQVESSDSPIYVSSEARPWLAGGAIPVRRAGVSAFGFGGTNFHVVLEEYSGNYLPTLASRHSWPAELFIWRAPSRAALQETLSEVEIWLTAGNAPPLRDLAYSVNLCSGLVGEPPIPYEAVGAVLAIVAADLDDLQQKISQAQAGLSAGQETFDDPRGIYLAGAEAFLRGTKIAFLFPGQGAQYPNMLRDLVMQFPQIRACFETADQTLEGCLPASLSSYVFPVPAHTDEQKQRRRQALTDTRIAQPALGAASLAMSGLLRQMGVHPDVVAGHSYGEIAALCEAGVISHAALLVISEARGRFMTEAAGPESGTMAAIMAGREMVAAVIAGIADLTLANLNSPTQTVISGAKESVEQALRRFEAQGVDARLLPVSCAFHSSFVASASDRLAEFLETIEFHSPRIDVFSNSIAGPYPQQPKDIRAILSRHMIEPVEFQREVEAMYAAGVRVFVETGPRNILSRLVDQILKDRPHVAIATDPRSASGLIALQQALGQLAARGVALGLDSLYDGRQVAAVDLCRPYVDPSQSRFGPTTWVVNGSRARPWKDVQANVPEPRVVPIEVRLANAGASSRSTEGSSAEEVHVDLQLEPLAPRTVAAPNASGVADHAGDGISQVMVQHQRLMARFLETQKNVMLTYLGAASATSSPLPRAPAHGVDQQAPAIPAAVVSAAPATPLAQDDSGPRAEVESLAPEALAQDLLELVSAQTGYPVDMLRLDADLEADLGIDSIKRIEILGAYRNRHPGLEALLSDGGMEQLQAKRTLRAIVDWVGAWVNDQHLPAASAGEGTDRGSELAGELEPAEPIMRAVLVPVETPLDGPAASLAPGRAVLITDDGQGIAPAVAKQLRARGMEAIVVTDRWDGASSPAGGLVADLTNGDQVRDLVAGLRRDHGPLGSLLHLAPLNGGPSFQSTDFAGWQRYLAHHVQGMLHLVLNLYDDWLSAAEEGGVCVLAATGMGGTFGFRSDGDAPSFFPGHGGLAGLLKTAAHEWPTVRFKAVDLDLRREPSLAVEAVLRELTASDGRVEVGYDGAARIGLAVVPLPFDQTTDCPPPVDAQSVVLVTGGARGITAEVAHELAVRYQPTLLLVGRSPPPAPLEAPSTAGLTAIEAIKKALVDSLSHNGQQPSLAEVEAAYRRLLREREMRTRLAAMEQAGATVRYLQADCREEAAFGALIDDVYRTYGRLDGVIHGAGIIEDKLLADKTPESFARVLSTKADSAFILSRKLRPESLKFLVFFSSVSATFGNRGQADYAAANEVMNKMALYLDRLWPGRVVSINWGPWDAPGMVSSGVREQFAQRGVSLVSVEAGRQRFVEELACGRKGEAEIVICGRDTQGMAAPLRTTRRPALV